MRHGTDKDISYLGDGVYASYDGYYIYLWTSDGMIESDRIAIEDYTLDALIMFAKKVGMIRGEV